MHSRTYTCNVIGEIQTLWMVLYLVCSMFNDIAGVKPVGSTHRILASGRASGMLPSFDSEQSQKMIEFVRLFWPMMIIRWAFCPFKKMLNLSVWMFQGLLFS